MKLFVELEVVYQFIDHLYSQREFYFEATVAGRYWDCLWVGQSFQGIIF